MKIAYEHLLRFLVDKPNINDLSDKLFQLGHEHEIENSIFDIEFTPNRGDCLSVKGLIRDLNVFYKTNLDIPIYRNELPSLDLKFINKAQDKCPHISFLNIKIEGKVSEYKDYLNNYFSDLNINKTNFFTDVSNYLAYEMGQPTHCYEFSSLGDDITLKEANNSGEFTTLFGNNINLNGLDLIFLSDEKIINLSGIIGGKDTACNNQTKNVLVECAFFKPESIIGKAVKYNVHSDASHKFERGTDPRCHQEALRRFVKIIEEHSKIIKLELYTFTGPDFKEVNLEFDLNKINDILGLDVSEDEYKNALINLGFNVNKTIAVPSYRNDIQHQNDLAEELARVIGYDNIPVSSLNINRNVNYLNSSNEHKIKDFLIDNGFIEVINSPFCPISSSDSIKVDNPLDSNREFIRTGLKESLIENLIYNEKRQKDSIKLFEISDVYSAKDNLLNQEKRIGIIVSGIRGHNYIDFKRSLDEDYLVSLFNSIDIDIKESIKKVDRNKLDSKIKTPVYIIEGKIETIFKNIDNSDSKSNLKEKFVKYNPISEFPSSSRDFSFSIKDISKVNEVIKVIEVAQMEYLKESFMFDFYENKKTGETKIGYRFIFQDTKKTLNDNTIDKVVDKLINDVLSIESVLLPGRI